jgi:starch synthase
MVLLPINLANYNMKDKRILYVSSEVVPYLLRMRCLYDVPKMINDQGGQSNFMPRYGNINEEDTNYMK